MITWIVIGVIVVIALGGIAIETDVGLRMWMIERVSLVNLGYVQIAF